MSYLRSVRSTAAILLCIATCATIIFSACSAGKKVPYFTNVSDSTYSPTVVELSTFNQPIIKPDDILQVNIQTIDPQTSSLFNSGNSSVGSGVGQGASSIAGYLVDREGNIELPLVGKIHVAGKTTIQAREAIKNNVKKYYVDPVVNIRFMNFNITLLGDVGRPGTYTIPTEKITILDALGLGGDLLISGKRENVMVIREENNEKKIVRLNLNSTDLMSSPYFYLQTGDVVYVEPNSAKARSATIDATKDRYISYGLSGVSIIISIILLTQQLKNR